MIKTTSIKKIFKGGEAYASSIISLIVLAILWSSLSPFFFTFANLKNIMAYISANGIMAVGITIVFILGGIDLSQMALMALSGMVAGYFYSTGAVSGFGIVLISIIVGLVGGLINGVIISKLNLLPFVATLGTQLIYRALAFILTDGTYIAIHDDVIRFIGFNTILGLPTMFWIMLLVYAIFAVVLKFTRIGRNIYSVGGGATVAKLSGINVEKTSIIGYAICGLTCGISSILYMAQGSIAMNSAGTGCEMDTMSAAILGGISMSGGRGNLLNTFLGVILLSVIENGMSLLSFDSYAKMFIKGIILLVAVFIDIIRQKKG